MLHYSTLLPALNVIKLLLEIRIRGNTKGVESNLTFLFSSWTLTSDCRAGDPVSIKPGKRSILRSILWLRTPWPVQLCKCIYLSFINIIPGQHKWLQLYKFLLLLRILYLFYTIQTFILVGTEYYCFSVHN